MTSQVDVKHWHEMIANPTVADAILDRLVHSAHRLNLAGEACAIRKIRRPSVANLTRTPPRDPLSLSMGGAVRLRRTAVRNGSDYCPASIVFTVRLRRNTQPRQPAVAGYEQRAPAVAAPQPAANSKTSEGFVPREQVMRIVKAMMADAQVDNYKILPPSADGQPAVVWRFEDGAVAKLQGRAGGGPTATAILPRLGNSAR